MHSSRTKPLSGHVNELPNELIIEILTWLPGKQLCRCKCVCKQWRTITRSRPFLETYRKRQRGLLLYWSEQRRLNFFHCPFRQLQERSEEFHPLSSLETGSRVSGGVSQMVNGLVCVYEDFVAIHNICTGERIRVPNPLPSMFTTSTYHIGYDPVRRLYKLLRLIYSGSDGLIRGAHIMTLEPPLRQLSTWRELDHNAAGISDMCSIKNRRDSLSDVRSSTNDGLLCWMWGDLVCFDVNTERFRCIEYPQELKSPKCKSLLGLTVFKDRLALWISYWEDGFNVISCLVQEDDEGKNWSEQSIEKSKEVRVSTDKFFPADNMPSSSSNGKIMVVNHDQPQRVFSYSHPQTEQPDKKDVFFVGDLPDETPPLARSGLFCSCSYTANNRYGKLCCFVEGNNLHLPLDDVFGGAFM